MSAVSIPAPELQIEFSYALGQLRTTYLYEALSHTLDKVNLATLDTELSEYVPQMLLKKLAKIGLRGELVFAVPCLLKANPFLLGYYRLILGFSQREFYTTQFGVSGFKAMETKGALSPKNNDRLPELCKGLISSAAALLEGIGSDRLSRELFDDLTLLTLGPQLRGGANVKKGLAGIIEVFQTIHEIVKHAATHSNAGRIELTNAAGRRVLIEFAPDPDIILREEIGNGRFRNIIAVEVKGGADAYTPHNRAGEAEKSHRKAKASGYVECWTVVNADHIDMALARRESPSTDRFYRLSALKASSGEEYQDFKERLIALTGIAAG